MVNSTLAQGSSPARNPFALILTYRRSLWRTAVSEVRQRYAGSALGAFWVMVVPFLLLSLYTCTFLFIFKGRPEGVDTTAYVLQILSGLLPLLGFSEGLISGSGALVSNRAVLLNTVYPAELVCVRAVLSSHVVAGFGFILVIAAALVLGGGGWALLLMPPVFALQLMFVCGLAWPLSLASLVLRDIQQLLTFLCTALMIASPIAYTPEAAPGLLRVLVYINPLSYFILTFQDLIMYGRLPPAPVILAVLALSFGPYLVGFRLFQRAKHAFWDYA
jgi:lipopolysaccharide transport system permease protein